LDQDEFRVEHDADVAAVERVLEQLSPQEVLRIAATQSVRVKYLERDRENKEKELRTLRTIIALEEEFIQQKETVHSAELKDQTRQIIRQLIALVPDMQRKSRSNNSKKAAVHRHAISETGVAKEHIKAEWWKERQMRPKGRWFSKFAEKMYCLYPEVGSPRTIQKWITDWEKEYEKVYT
jgi:hypothetical protein